MEIQKLRLENTQGIATYLHRYGDATRRVQKPTLLVAMVAEGLAKSFLTVQEVISTGCVAAAEKVTKGILYSIIQKKITFGCFALCVELIAEDFMSNMRVKLLYICGKKTTI